MGALEAEFTWPGLTHFRSGSYTCSHGVSPGVATITVASASGPPDANGSLLITDGVRNVALHGCRVDNITGGLGQDRVISILDRRWKWQYGRISGHYNRRDVKGNVIPASARTPAQLAALCFGAVGEVAPTILVPDPISREGYPEVEWVEEVPMAALATLADSWGCRIFLNPNTDQAGIAPVGAGTQTLPGDGMLREVVGLDPPEPPGGIVVVGLPAYFECRIPLEAVGEEPDGRIVPINQLSYRPSSGDWSTTEARQFNAAEETTRLTRDEARQLAQKCVWRYYRVKVPQGGIEIPGYPKKVTRRDQIVFAGVASLTDNYGRLIDFSRPAITTGTITVNRAKDPIVLGEGDPTLIPITVDQERGLVIHDEVAVMIEVNKFYEPTLYYQGCVMVRDADTHAYVRYEKRYPLGRNTGVPDLAYLVSELQYVVTAQYTPEYSATKTIPQYKPPPRPSVDRYVYGGKTTTNVEIVSPRADWEALGVIARYQTKAPLTRTLVGIQPIGIDGACQQVTWECGPGVCQTTATLNGEHSTYIPPYPVRRRFESVPINFVSNERALQIEAQNAQPVAASPVVGKKGK